MAALAESTVLPREVPISKRRAPTVAPEVKLRAMRSLAGWVARAQKQFNRPLFMPTISFDLCGTTAGKAYFAKRHIQLNAVLLSENLEDFESDTIPHELSHLLVLHLYGTPGGHGAEWKAVMRKLGVAPERTHSFDTSNARKGSPPTSYRCGCMKHALSSRRHNKVLRGRHYACGKCGQRLTLDVVLSLAVVAKPVKAPSPAVRPVVPSTPMSVAITHPPTDDLLRFAKALALKHKTPVPALALVDYAACAEFLSRLALALARAVTPPTERQLAFAHSIAKRKGMAIPSDVLASKELISQWIQSENAVAIPL